MFGIKTKIKWLLVGVLIFANFFVWRGLVDNKTPDFLTLAVLDIGQGDSLFLEDSSGHQILIDGGPDNKILAELPKLMPVTDRSLDLLILSHPHADHLAGLVEILKRYEVRGVLESGAIYDSATYDEWHKLLAEKKIPVILARRGERIILSGHAELDVLAPFANWRGRGAKNIHEAMVVTQLFVASSSVALFTGDMEQDLENNLVATGDNLESEILKVGHHGSKTSTGLDFLKAVSPQFAVISVGAKNRYGHPAPQTLTNLKNSGAKVLRTDEEGTIIFQVDKLTGAISEKGLD